MTEADPTQAATPFRGWVRHGTQFTIEELRLEPRRPSDVVVRNLAAQACYTIVENVSTLPAPQARAVSPGHGAMGVVVEIGSAVQRVAVGDRVVTPVTPSCGTCYSCVRGEWFACGHKSDIHFAHPDNPPFATMADGTEVWQDHTGGFAELAVVHESWAVPVNDSPLSSVELASLACVPGPGWTFGLVGMPITIASSVAVIGAGPLGLSIIQAARMMGARLIIAVEPIAHRREAAKAAGAHVVVDPDEDGVDVVATIRELCAPGTENLAAGGKPLDGFYDGRGADHVYEATGRTFGEPSMGMPRDPTGAQAVSWGFKATRRGGTFTHTGWTAPTSDPELWEPAPGPFDYHGKKFLSAAYGGGNVLRDIPRLAKLIEMGYLDATALVDPVLPWERGDEALWHALNRDALLPIITFEE